MNGSGYAVLLIDDDELGGGGLSRGDTVGALCSKEIGPRNQSTAK